MPLQSRIIKNIASDSEMKELWKAIPGAPAYEVSSFGRVRRIAASRGAKLGRILRHFSNGVGYPTVVLSVDNRKSRKLVHRLVLEAFNGPPPAGRPYAAHWDGDRSNCHLDNLRWVSQSENETDKLRHGTHRRGDRHPLHKLSPSQAAEAKRRRTSGESYSVIARDLGVTPNTISRLIRGISWRAPENTPC